MTFTANQRLTIVLSVIFALVGVGIISYAAGASNERAVPLADRWLYECTYEDAEAHSVDVVSILMNEGWYSTPTDGVERIYSPACADK